MGLALARCYQRRVDGDARAQSSVLFWRLVVLMALAPWPLVYVWVYGLALGSLAVLCGLSFVHVIVSLAVFHALLGPIRTWERERSRDALVEADRALNALQPRYVLINGLLWLVTQGTALTLGILDIGPPQTPGPPEILGGVILPLVVAWSVVRKPRA